MTDKAKNYGFPTRPKGPRQDSGFLWIYYEARGERFISWDGGGKIGGGRDGWHNSAEAAEAYLTNYAERRLTERIRALTADLAITQRSLDVLNTKGLEAFEVPADWNPAKANGKKSY